MAFKDTQTAEGESNICSVHVKPVDARVERNAVTFRTRRAMRAHLIAVTLSNNTHVEHSVEC